MARTVEVMRAVGTIRDPAKPVVAVPGGEAISCHAQGFGQHAKGACPARAADQFERCSCCSLPGQYSIWRPQHHGILFV